MYEVNEGRSEGQAVNNNFLFVCLFTLEVLFAAFLTLRYVLNGESYYMEALY